MIVLGIESTAHTFGIGLINFKKKKILFNEKITFNGEQGMDLRKLTNFHMANFEKLLIELKKFLKKKKINFEEIGLISFSRGPGIGNSLKIGALISKTLSLKYSIPIIGVNHIVSHFEIGKWVTNLENPIFLNITGVNSQIVSKNKKNEYIVYGETLDIGLGNLFDSVARLFDLGFPGGPKMEKLAEKSKNNYIELPYKLKGMNVSFSGIYTFIKNRFDKIENEKEKEKFIYDICYSLQETCFSMLLEICERAINYTKKKN